MYIHMCIETAVLAVAIDDDASIDDSSITDDLSIAIRIHDSRFTIHVSNLLSFRSGSCFLNPVAEL